VHPRLVLGLFLAGLLALAAAAWAIVASRDAADEGPRAAFAGSRMPDGVRAPRFALSDERGERLAFDDLRGRPVIVTFLYTHCEDTCPPAAQQVKGALDELGEDVPAVAIAVDPPRDTAASARAFLAEQRMLGRMRFALGSRRQLAPVWRGFAIRPQSARTEHQARIVLVDRRGYQRVGFPIAQATPERIAHDVRILLAEA
jgi:protein SCO1/2